MPNLTSVGVASGIPNSGTGTVSTIDALMVDGGLVTLGAKADAKSTATDTTAITLMQVSKQISASVQAIATALAAGAAAIAKAEDVASVAADTGVPAMIVQTAAPANTAADGDYAFLQADGGYAWVATPKLVKVSANFTVAAGSSHTANDNISDNGTAGSVTKLSWAAARVNGVIRRVRIRKSDQTVATPTLRLWLWDTTFTVASGDDAAFSQPLQDTIGFVDVACTNAGTDDAVGWTNCDIPFSTATVFGLIQTLTTFTTAASEVFTIDLWYDPR